jgi:hypothetical protein
LTARDRLEVRVNNELVLDAGTCEGVSGPHGPETLIRPPETTLFHQVLAYLKAKPDPPQRPSGTMVGREAVAAAALTVRWGSYLAVLVDHDKPVWPAVSLMGTSRISDEEMARINIEASAALADWIDLYRADPGGRFYRQLVDRAVAYLPMPIARRREPGSSGAGPDAATTSPGCGAVPLPWDSWALPSSGSARRGVGGGCRRAVMARTGAALRSGLDDVGHAVGLDPDGGLA